MEIAGLALAIPPTIGGILKCIKLFKEISDKFQGADDRVQRIMAVCRMLEMALLQLEPAGADRPDGPLSLMPANCAKIITSMETLLRKLGVDPGDATTVTDLKRIEYVWKDDEVASLTKLMDQCRDDIQFYLVLQLYVLLFSIRLMLVIGLSVTYVDLDIIPKGQKDWNLQSCRRKLRATVL